MKIQRLFSRNAALFVSSLLIGIGSLAQSCAPRRPYRASLPSLRVPPAAQPTLLPPGSQPASPPIQETLRPTLPEERRIREQDLESGQTWPAPVEQGALTPSPEYGTMPGAESIAPPLADDSSLLAKITPQTPPQRAASLRLTEEGRKLLDAGDARRALTRLERTIAIDSTNGYAYYFIAKAQYMLGKFNESLNFLDVADSRLNGEDFWLAEVHALRGENLRAMGKESQAEAAYAEALRFNSGNRTAVEALGRVGAEHPAVRP